MSNAQRQSRPSSTPTLPPIYNLINAANEGMSQQRQSNGRQPYYPPTPPGPARGLPQMYGQNIQLPPLASQPRPRSRNDPAYPTPPNSARSDGSMYPAPSAGAVGGTGSRRHVCTQCNQAFDRPSSLQTHMHTHTGEQPHECPYPGCGRRFSVRSNMRRHMNVHEQPRMMDADAEGDDPRDPRHDCEYGVFPIGQR
ncbi:hypothetical protein BDV93DRAFT_559286 [Ceratobasidium sp. AG-I]|nr:hypothetical protein BDV93DRAFT_559286 [Ceratobasidium sp. AG-I]